MKTLKKRLANGIASVYIVEGDDLYLFDKAQSMIISACNISMPDFNITILDDDNFSLEALFEAEEVLPAFDERRVVVIKGGKVKESEKKKLIDMLSKTPKTSVTIMLDYNKNFEFLKNEFVLVDASRMDREMVQKLVQAYLAKLGKSITMEALNYLIDSCNGYLTRIMSELNKIVYYDLDMSEIPLPVVENMVTQEVEHSVFELTEALAKKQGDRALKIVKLMEKEQGVMALIQNQFRRLFYCSVSELSNKELSVLLGVKEYAILKSRQLCRGFSKAQLKKILSKLEEIDYMIKSGDVSQINGLYMLVFNIIYV